MKTAALIIGALALAGCVNTSAIKTCANGDKWEVRSTRLFWQTDAVKVVVQTNGATAVEVTNTKSDGEAMKAGAEAGGAFMGAMIKAATTK